LRHVVVPTPGEVPAATLVGGKAHNLARLGTVAGARVPPWFALAVTAHERFASSTELPAALGEELTAALTARGLMGRTLAVRSSATAEDAASASFAGQFASVLGVEAEPSLAAVWTAIRAVWDSSRNAHALAYAGARADGAATRMGVVIQALVPARAAGVAFSLDPVSGDRSVAVVSSVLGLGERLVSGEADADTFRVRGAEIASVEPATTLDALSITEAQAIEVARMARTLETAFGTPQDVEWAFAPTTPGGDDELHIVQARPITAAAPRGERRLWDNSNIVESYGGVTTPLTYSFARGVYEEVYRQFLDVLGVHPSLIEARRDVLANMLGLIEGRVYYDLLNWYRVLALLPGYALNRPFMERMMGVREALADPPPPPSSGERWRDGGRALRMLWRLWREHRAMDANVAAFLALVDRTLAPVEREPLERLDATALVARYRALEAALLKHWRAPLVNDFFAMIWFGILGRLVEKWLPGSPPTLVNDLLVGEGGIISTEPARWLMRLARLEESDPAFAKGVQEYLDKFGDRCVGELKLETLPPRDDPGFVERMVRGYRAQGVAADDGGARESAIRTAAESHVRSRLGAVRRRVLFFVLGHARARIRDRENLRFERTRVFGAVRRLFATIGRRLHERGALRAPRQVFHLTTDEVFAAAATGSAPRDWATLAEQRIEEFAGYERSPAPPERFETFGAVVVPRQSPSRVAGSGSDPAELRGLGCCPGVVRAPVRVVRDPSKAGQLAGHILVAERTDPGWTLLFPSASGLLVQRGSLLSHSAIVAREIGLPCVVAIPGLMEVLVDGELVEMDGATGVVRRLGKS
jgi:phosphohistidine swiveling domain-containing protein